LNALRCLTESSVKTWLVVILASVLTATTVWAQEPSQNEAKGDKDKVVREVYDNWIEIGTEQYKRGFYSAAETSFLRAKDYEDILLTRKGKTSTKICRKPIKRRSKGKAR